MGRTGPERARTEALLDWFAAERRALPWRRDRDPYRIWIAEVLLQQTRVDQAVPYFERFVRRFPTVQRLAAAPPEAVLKVWEGAGYYGRARRLSEAARRIVAERGGRLPTRSEELEELPGFGPYIAAAVASLAFDEPVVALDANAARVAARWSRYAGVAGTAAGRRHLERVLARGLPADRAAAYNEAVMELGERVCRPAAPDCPACPVRRHCGTFRAKDDPRRFPGRRPRRARPHHRVAVVVLTRRGRWLVQRRPDGGLLGGLWEFPGGHLGPGERPVAAARRELREETGLRAGTLRAIGVVRHAYSHFSVDLHVYTGSPLDGVRSESRTARWVTPEEFARLPRPTATRRIVGELLERPRGGASRGSGSPRGRAAA